MKAMIFAAGLGTRLRPFTNDRPKALAEINGVTMLEIVIRRLQHFGFNEILVNVHHFAEKIREFLEARNFGMDIQISDESQQLLDTGGGLKKASWFFDDGSPFLVHNVDTLTNVNLLDFYEYHQQNRSLATLLVRHRPGSRFFLFDKTKRLWGWQNVETGAKIISDNAPAELEQIAFSCLHVIDPVIFDQMEEDGSFSIIDVYLRLAGHYQIFGFVDDESYWMDIGTPEKLKKAEKDFESGKILF
jgi:NDP-sugar pyrophosphorylase family protein